MEFKGSWDPLDFGDYVISTNGGAVTSTGGQQAVSTREIGAFNVRIEDPTVLYADTFSDQPGQGSLRDALATANASDQAHTIILEGGSYTIETPHVVDPGSSFPNPVRPVRRLTTSVVGRVSQPVTLTYTAMSQSSGTAIAKRSSMHEVLIASSRFIPVHRFH